MAEQNAPSAVDETQPVLSYEKIYIKDMSIEVPHAPSIFLEQDAPQLETQLNVDASNFAEGLYEVVVTATVSTKIADKIVFLVEVGQAGIFQIRNFPAEQLDPLIGIHCASVLYPYLRANVADLITRAGFPALHLPNVNFEAFYQQRLEQAQAGSAGPTTIMSPNSTH